MDEGREFRFVAEKVYSIPGRGVVVTGRVERGNVAVGDEIGFLGGEGRYVGASVLAIEVSRSLVDTAEAGQQASLLLQGVKKNQITTGAIFTASPESPPIPVYSSPSETTYSGPASSTPTPYGASPIEPSSGSLRIAFLVLIGVLILLLLLFYLGKWDPREWDPRKLTSIPSSECGGGWSPAHPGSQDLIQPV